MSFIQVTPRPGTSERASAFDMNALQKLRRAVSEVSGQTGATVEGGVTDAEREIAHQFEALFLQQVLKQSRRQPLSGLFQSDGVKFAQGLADEQAALELANPGTGLAEKLLDMIRSRRQATGPEADAMFATDSLQATAVSPGTGHALDSATGPVAESIDELLTMLGEARQRSEGASGTGWNGVLPAQAGMNARYPEATGMNAAFRRVRSVAEKVQGAIDGAPRHIREFVTRMSAAARVASEQSGIHARLILGQAALETGWGQREILREDGSPSYNVFGIKAGRGWEGDVTHVMTTEFIDGRARKVKEPFRAYGSYEEAFADYARLVGSSPRYAEVLTAPSAEVAAQRIQAAGYATDPAYAEKLVSVMSYFDTGRKQRG